MNMGEHHEQCTPLTPCQHPDHDRDDGIAGKTGLADWKARALAAEAECERLREALKNVEWGLRHTLDGAKVLGDSMDAPVRLRGDLEATWVTSCEAWLAVARDCLERMGARDGA